MNETPRLPDKTVSWRARLSAVLAAVMASYCNAPPTPTVPVQPPTPPPPAPPVGIAPPKAVQTPVSQASTALAYRQDAARHLYRLNASRIFHGKLPPMLYAIGVLQVDLDRHGQVTALHWMRAPKHAPEVIADIEQTVRRAAPYPVAVRLGKVTYTDTWLWHKDGRFQLHTLTEGQL